MLYPVRDLYGMKVLADTLGGIEPKLGCARRLGQLLLSHLRQHQLSPADYHRAEEPGLYLCIRNGCLVRINDQVLQKPQVLR